MTLNERGRKGGKVSVAQRRAEKAAGMAAARAWRAEHHPAPAFGHMPFEGHRSQAEVGLDEAERSFAA